MTEAQRLVLLALSVLQLCYAHVTSLQQRLFVLSLQVRLVGMCQSQEKFVFVECEFYKTNPFECECEFNNTLT